MKALFLPTEDERVDAVKKSIIHRGHDALYPEGKEQFLAEFHICDVVLALGKLTPLGIWLWGYSYGRRKRVRAFKGVTPCFVSRTILLEKWVDEIPEQLSLFSLLQGDPDEV